MIKGVQRVALTQAPGRLEGLQSLLAGRGFEVVRRPLIDTVVRRDSKTIAVALTLSSLPWLLFTSRTAVTALVELGVGFSRRHGNPRFGAVGPATAAAIEAEGGKVDVLGVPQDAEGLARAFLAHPNAVGPVGLPCGNRSRGVLPRILGDAGIASVPLVVYDTVTLSWTDRGASEGSDGVDNSEIGGRVVVDSAFGDRAIGDRAIGGRASGRLTGEADDRSAGYDGKVDAVVLASPSAVEALPEEVARSARLVTLGATTSAAVRRRGWSCEEAAAPTPEETLAAVERVLS